MGATGPTVVLIHGLFGFRKLLWLEYFQGVPKLLESLGLRVVVPILPWGAGIEACAKALDEQLQGVPGPLHLLGHSMGGVTARYWISRMGGADRVASLTTLSSPHRGSPAADQVCARAWLPFRLFAGVRDLTTTAMAQFNREASNDGGVIYRSYSAARPIDELPWITRIHARLIAACEGENDSQVSVKSAIWGEHVATLPSDHFELISRNFWFNPLRRRCRFDPMPVYSEIGRWIVAQGE